MVAGRVKAAMGFQRSPKEAAKSPAPAPAPHVRRTPETPTRGSSSGSPAPAGSASKAVSFARSLGVHFPRSSAQVQPARAPPEVAELLRAIEQLQERESRLRVELLEQKILKETVAIVPFLEAELAAKSSELEKCKETASRLESENMRLCAELDAAVLEVTSRKQRIVRMEKEMEELKKQQEAAAADADDCSSTASVSHEQTESSSASANPASLARRPSIPPPPPPMPPAASKSKAYSASSRASPPSTSAPSPSSSTSTSPTYSGSSSDTAATPRNRKPELSKLPPIPPPPPMPALSVCGRAAAPPPPPPPPPARRTSGATSPAVSGPRVTRVPEVVEFYHSLMRRDSRSRDGSGGGETANGGGVAAARDMIGEIENRSAHLLAIKSDVERQGDFIRFLIKEVEGAAFVDIEDVVTFVKWLDNELSRLVDERAVLKHFEWPEHKADALREAAFGYCDLKKLEVEASSFRDDARQPCAAALKKMQALFEKLEHGVYNLARIRDGATGRYSRFQIPCEWMQQDTGIVSQIKLQSVMLAMKYLKRVSSELEAIKGGPDEEELMLQGVRFAFRVHQFAGGFDVDTMRAFQELKEKASMCRLQRQEQNRHLRQQKLVART
ncbi:protein CHUP1, chloroplastic-like [Oryza brachyantha]|uniref:Protein CHUP1, chloroplastic n=1 Tax=Oryza brachyantha TaxID=4533 RepID=J3L2E3_ORYBR|nr:protein CHUP1, chloroplastic-like [Oryza brachyantha]